MVVLLLLRETMALAVTHSGALGACDDAAEFAYALDFILDGLDRLQGG